MPSPDSHGREAASQLSRLRSVLPAAKQDGRALQSDPWRGVRTAEETEHRAAFKERSRRAKRRTEADHGAGEGGPAATGNGATAAAVPLGKPAPRACGTLFRVSPADIRSYADTRTCTRISRQYS